MKIAFNGPKSLQKDFDVGDIHYALAHECLARREECDFYRNSSKPVILDNGADEIGAGISGEQLRHLIAYIKPDVCILPDVLGHGQITSYRGSQFLSESQWLPYQPEWMGVVQGRSFGEFVESLDWWEGHHDVSIIGIPYDLDFAMPGDPEVPLSKSLLRAHRRAWVLANMVTTYEGKRIHLLGMNHLNEFQMIREMVPKGVTDRIVSHDTTAPFAAAAIGRRFYRTIHGNYDSGEKDWPRLDFDAEFTEEKKSVLKDNLDLYFKATACLR